MSDLDPELDDALDADQDSDFDARMEAYLQDKYGDGFTADNLDQWAKEKRGWLSRENEHTRAAAEARREAEELRDKWTERAADGGAEPRSEPVTGSGATSGAGEVSEDEFYQYLGLKGSDDVLTADKAFGLWKAASAYMVGQQAVVGEELGKVYGKIGELEVTKTEFESLREDLAQSLARNFEKEVLEKFPDADPKDISEAIAEAPEGDAFNEYVFAAAEESEKRIHEIAAKSKGGKARRRHQASKIHTGAGPAGRVQGKRPASVLTNKGLQDFARRTSPALGNDDT